MPGQKAKRGSPGGRDVEVDSPRPAAQAGPGPEIVIGIGASAGGLGPLQTLLSGLPPGRGLAVVIVQHQDAASGSLLSTLIAAHTPLTVVEAADGMAIAADHVYVVPAERSLAVIEDSLSVREVPECRGLRMPIDHFLCTLAATQGRRAVGVILSGTGIDGTHGLAEIKALGGVTAAQDPATAEFAEMPHSARAAGHADVALPPEALAAFVLRRADALAALTAHQRQEAGLEAVLAAVRHTTGHDFHCYKHGTLERRIRRRMGLLRLADYDDYARIVRAEREEAAAMRKDLLIGVTEFFRQAEAWRVLEEKAVAELVAAAEPGATLRMWVPACATGKEPYSLAMLLVETVERSGKKLGVQLFATDADPTAVEAARRGYYAEDDLKGISQTRLRRFFLRKNGRYEVIKQLRELIVFAPQDLTSDPPFSKLDLVSCRNLLIYLDASVQKKIIQLFHFALHERGYLFLGSAETISGQENLFEAVSQKWRIYRKLGVSTPVGLDLPLRPAARPAIALPDAGPQGRPTLPAIAYQALADRYGPPAAVVDRKGTLLYLCGGVEDYLQMPAGEQTGLLADAAREGLRNRLASAVLQAISENKKVIVTARVKKDRKTVPVKVSVSPLRHPREADGLLLVTFEQQKLPRAAQAAAAAAEGEIPRSDLRQLEDELKITREELSSTIEQLEQSNEHLKASNEEVTSANEELQSANEELETSKEELQSLNEELNAVNQRLQEKVVELELAGNDVANLLTSGGVATIFLDRRLQVRRFTPAVTDLLSLIDGDIGRPIADITRKFQDEALLDDARRVLVDLTPATAEVQADSGQWYQRRILPYRTKDDRIEGVVITFADVTEMKELTDALRVSEEAMREAHARAAWLARFPQENPNPVLRVSADGTVLYCNPASAELPGWGCKVGEPVPQPLAALVGRAFAQGEQAQIEAAFGERTFLVWASAFPKDCYANVYGRDITDRKRAEESLRQSERRERERAEELAVIFEAVPAPVFIARDPDCLHLTGNRLADEILRVPPGKELSMTGPEETRPRHFRVLKDGRELGLDELPAQRAARGEQVKDFELTLAFDDGMIRHVLGYGTPLLDDQGRPRGCVAVLVDITDRKRAEESLRTALRRFYDVLASMYAGVLLVTDDGRVEYANQAMCDRFGLAEAPADLVGLASRDMIEKIKNGYLHPDQAVARIREILERGQPVRGEEVAMKGGGACLRDYVPLNIQGKSFGRLWIHVDITDRKRAEEEIRQHLEELRAANDDLARFNRAAVDRELRMIELKKEINGLCARAGEPTRYTLESEENQS